MKRFRFWEDNRVILEIFGSFSYSFPEDRKKQMADFYMLQLLLGRDSFERERKKAWEKGEQDPYIMGGPRKLSDEDWTEEDKIDYMLNEVADELLPKLKKQLLDELVFCVTAEIRHVFGANQTKNIFNKIKKDLGEKEADYFKKYVKYISLIGSHYSFLSNRFDEPSDLPFNGNNPSYMSSYVAFKRTGASPSEWIDLCKYLFEEAKWSPSFGGKAWAQIAEGWKKLNKAKTRSELFTYIDHVYDLQHNTGTVFTKIKDYKISGVFSWINDFLDKKRDIENPMELVGDVSRSFKKLALRAVKMKWGNSLDKFKPQLQSKQLDKNNEEESDDDIITAFISATKEQSDLSIELIIAKTIHFYDITLSKFLSFMKERISVNLNNVEPYIKVLKKYEDFFSERSVSIEEFNLSVKNNELKELINREFGGSAAGIIALISDKTKKEIKMLLNQKFNTESMITNIQNILLASGEMILKSDKSIANLAGYIHLVMHEVGSCKCVVESKEDAKEVDDSKEVYSIKYKWNNLYKSSPNPTVTLAKLDFYYRNSPVFLKIIPQTINLDINQIRKTVEYKTMYTLLAKITTAKSMYLDKPIKSFSKADLDNMQSSIMSKLKGLSDLFDSGTWDSIFDYLNLGNKVHVIKLIREAAGIDLKGAKYIAEAIHIIRHAHNLCKCDKEYF